MRREPPPDVSLYQQASYWDDRFAQEEHYEWFKEYSHFRHLILQNIQPSDRVLELGCGNSRLSLDMFQDGIRKITCTDLSSIAVQQMQRRLEAENCTGVNVAVADMLDLPFGDNSFDVVIEKGTMWLKLGENPKISKKRSQFKLQPKVLDFDNRFANFMQDVLFVNSGDPWDPKTETRNSVASMLESVHRVLSPNGVFISISFSQPHFRRLVFEDDRYSWSMKWATFGDAFHYFFYTLRKGTYEKPSDTRTRRLQLDLVQDHMNQEDYLLQALLDES